MTSGFGSTATGRSGQKLLTVALMMALAAGVLGGQSVARAESVEETFSKFTEALLYHESLEVREAAAHALSRIGGPEAHEALLNAGFLDWPMWQYDAARSANTPLVLAEELHVQWVRELPAPKRAWRHQWDHRGKLDFDVSYAPVVKGAHIFVPSNVTDSVTAYRIEDGAEVWRFYADGPVRVAPVAWEDRVFFVSDDGHLYCLDAATGDLAWKFSGAPSDHRLLGNERIISFWAARGGPVVKDGTLYFAAGIWPMHGVFVYALDARSGDVVWVNDTTSSEYVQLPHGGATGIGSIAPQGYIAATADTLVVAGGRTPPAFLNRHTGALEEVALRAKPAGGYAVHGGGQGMQRNAMVAARVQALGEQIEGGVFYQLAARDRLFVTAKDGTLYCFGPEETAPVRHDYRPAELRPRTDAWATAAQELLDGLGESDGYALMLGAGSGDLLRELLLRSELHIAVAEADGARVQALRDELAAAGLYGRRAAVIEANPATFAVQPYLFSLVVSEDAEAAGLGADTGLMAHVLDRLRPYGGVAYLGAAAGLDALAEAAQGAAVDQVSVEAREEYLFAARGGPLTGAGQWTHQYADSSNTNFSPDTRVKAPLGILWFGGPCNSNILPRHGHGPLPQAVGGRLILLGVETISARCVYTGRELWVREFPEIGHPFTVLELEAEYEEGKSVFMHSANGIGANQLGGPFVSLADAIYLRYMTRIYQLAPESGEIVAEFQLPVADELEGKPDWGHLSVWNDVIITTVEPQVFDGEHYSEVFQTMADLKSRSWDGTSSRQLVVLDRATGEVLWTRDAAIGFRHNAIVSGGDRLYVIDGLSDTVVEHLQRRGEVPEDAVLMALDPRSGEELWSRDTGIFGTWLGYSAEHGLLLQGGRQGGLRTLEDEPSDRIAVYEARSGTPVWEETFQDYWGPLSIRGETVYCAPAGSSGTGRALNLLTGEEKMREQPLTGERAVWTYNRRYGCNSQNVSEHLITFRSGAAAFFDLEYDSGTGVFGGFRSGCTNNLVVAEGVLNAPDYTRTCTCSYQHQTSLALIHMPDMSGIEAWTVYDAAQHDPRGYGVNFGAPGRRVDRASGLIWHDEEGTHRRHVAFIADTGGGIDWVAASARELNGDEEEGITVYDLLDANYTVRLHFAELGQDVEPGDRVFDVLLDGEEVLSDFDIVEAAGGCLRGVVREFTVDANMTMTVDLRKSENSRLEPLISGIEFIATETEMTMAAR